jgi:transposase
LSEVEGLKSAQRPKALLLIEVAGNSIGVKKGREMARIEIVTLARNYHQFEQNIEILLNTWLSL